MLSRKDSPILNHIGEHLLRGVTKDFILLSVHIEKIINHWIRLMPTIYARHYVKYFTYIVLFSSCYISILMRELKFRKAEDFTQDHVAVKCQSNCPYVLITAVYTYLEKLARETTISSSSDETICMVIIPLNSSLHRSSLHYFLLIQDSF